jgi:hypothetical protein
VIGALNTKLLPLADCDADLRVDDVTGDNRAMLAGALEEDASVRAYWYDADLLLLAPSMQLEEGSTVPLAAMQNADGCISSRGAETWIYVLGLPVQNKIGGVSWWWQWCQCATGSGFSSGVWTSGTVSTGRGS